MKKLRGKFSGIKPQLIFIIFGLGVLAVVPIRMYQVITLIEPETGFYTQNSIVTWIFYGLLAAVSITLLVLSYLSGSLPSSEPPKGRSLPLMITSALMVVALLVDAITQVVSVIVGLVDPTTYSGSVKSLISSGILPLMFQTVFALFAAIYFMIIVLSYFDMRIRYTEYKLLAITPLVWAICRIIHRFMRTISYKNVSDLLLEMFMLVAMMLFFLSVARISSHVENDGMIHRTMSCGLICTIFCLTCAIPRLVLTVTGNADMIAAGSPLEYCDIAVAAFILAYLFSILRPNKGTQEDNQDIE